eukprot:11893645-Alexandrium_andersonii.AAC.1
MSSCSPWLVAQAMLEGRGPSTRPRQLVAGLCDQARGSSRGDGGPLAQPPPSGTKCPAKDADHALDPA